MRLQRNGKILEILEPNHINAFKSAGWVEYIEEEVQENVVPAPKSKGRPKKTTTDIEK